MVHNKGHGELHDKGHGELHIVVYAAMHLLVCYRLTCLDGENKPGEGCNTENIQLQIFNYARYKVWCWALNRIACKVKSLAQKGVNSCAFIHKWLMSLSLIVFSNIIY